MALDGKVYMSYFSYDEEMMYAIDKMTVTFDLGKESKNAGAERTRVELVELVKNRPGDDYQGIKYGEIKLRPVAGMLVRATFGDGGHGTVPLESLGAFKGLRVALVTVEASGSDHFPPAGLYRRASTHATVSYDLKKDYPAEEEFLRELIRAAYDDARYSQETRLVIPVVHWRSWKLKLTTPSVNSAFVYYERIRGGKWLPEVPFTDALTDQKKIHLVEQTIEPAYTYAPDER